MEQQWIEHLRKRFADRKVAPPDGLWESVLSAMGGKSAVDGARAGRSRRAVVVPMWRRRAVAVAACAAVLGVTVWLFYGRDAVPYAAVGGGQALGVSVDRLAEAATPAVDAGVPLSVKDAVRRVEAVVAGLEGNVSDVAATSADIVVMADTANVGGDAALGDGRNADGRSVVVRRAPVDGGSRDAGGNGLLASAGGRVGGGGGVSVSLYGAGFTSIGTSTGNTGASLRPYKMQQGAVADNDIMLLSAATDGMKASEVRVKHRHPVKLGASVRFGLAGRFGLETGLNYSYHSSDIASGDDKGGYTTEQKLHFVGIPVAVSYDIWHTDFLEVYASAGGAAEFCVSGRSHTEYVEDGKVTGTANADVRDKRPQWSVGASAGVQYNVSNAIGVYVEPGVSYYFDNGSGVNTVYKDKPLNFNLNVGLRFTFR